MQIEAVRNPDLVTLNREYGAQHVPRHNMTTFRAPKIDTVRVGVIGLGNRGPNHVKALVQVGNVEIRALCDKTPQQIQRGLAWTQAAGHEPTIHTGSEDAWQACCQQADLDLIFVCTPIPLHAPISIYAMRQGKHVACEVPAAWEMADCWKLVQAAEETRRHFMMLENYSYMTFQLQTLMMAKAGFFGDIVHAEGAYNTSKVNNNLGSKAKGTLGTGNYTDWWWLKAYAERRGNLYPTHGVGPIAQIMDINRGDQFDYMVSMESGDFNLAAKARELAQDDPDTYTPLSKLAYRGNMNTTLIRTVRGRTIVVQHDAHTPQPHNLIHGIYGTAGCALFDPPPPRIATGGHWVEESDCTAIRERFTPELARKLGASAERHGHGGSDLRMDWHLIDCLRNGLPMPQDVYDAAAWSALAPLSQWSVLNRSSAIDIPDFTAGAWETNPRNMDINFESGGGNTDLLPPVEPATDVDDALARQWAQDHG